MGMRPGFPCRRIWLGCTQILNEIIFVMHRVRHDTEWSHKVELNVYSIEERVKNTEERISRRGSTHWRNGRNQSIGFYSLWQRCPTIGLLFYSCLSIHCSDRFLALMSLCIPQPHDLLRLPRLFHPPPRYPLHNRFRIRGIGIALGTRIFSHSCHVSTQDQLTSLDVLHNIVLLLGPLFYALVAYSVNTRSSKSIHLHRFKSSLICFR